MGGHNTLWPHHSQHHFNLGVSPGQGAELLKVDLTISVGANAHYHPLDLVFVVRELVRVHQSGQAAITHAALYLADAESSNSKKNQMSALQFKKKFSSELQNFL